jgi:hypothetical protein
MTTDFEIRLMSSPGPVAGTADCFRASSQGAVGFGEVILPQRAPHCEEKGP